MRLRNVASCGVTSNGAVRRSVGKCMAGRKKRCSGRLGVMIGQAADRRRIAEGACVM